MGTVVKPILLDETGKEIAAHMDTQNKLLGALVRDSFGEFVSWNKIRSAVRSGLARELFNIGDQFIVSWYDSGTENHYQVPLDVVHFDNVELENGKIVPGMFLQWHYATPFAIAFDSKEGTSASGTFKSGYQYVRSSDGRYRNIMREGIDYTVGDTIPNDGNYAYYYGEIIDGSGAIYNYGYNRWSHSAIRQFLNSDDTRGGDNWWKEQHIGDAYYPDAITRNGFLAGFDPDFQSVLTPIKVTTVCQHLDSGSYDVYDVDYTYDKFFLPSYSQMYAVDTGLPDALKDVEGSPFTYWKDASPTVEPHKVNDAVVPAYRTYAINDTTVPAQVMLRSIHSNGVYYHGEIWADGSIATSFSNYGTSFAPVCVIC